MKRILPEVQVMFGRTGRFDRWLRIEAALARAQAELGIIPKRAAADIAAAASVERLDFDKYDALYEKTGHPLVAMLRLLEAAAGPESGQYIHLGATTHDIMDSAMMLAIKEMYQHIDAKLSSMLKTIGSLTLQYADTPMIGRTHNVHALPITFGYKTAIWGDELWRLRERMQTSRERVLALQMSGAVGSMVSFAPDGQKLQVELSRLLGLSVPEVCWHTSRDRLAEFVAQLTLLAGALGRISREVYLLMGTEISELSETWGDGRVGSSTMPHKVNPTSTQHMMSLARDIRYHNGAVMEMMEVEHERDMMHFIGEREHLEGCCIAAAELVDRGDELLTGLVVNTSAMKRNLALLGGLTQSEHVMLELGKHIGKQNAHECINKIAVSAYQSGESFAACLKQNEEIARYLTETEIDHLLEPLAYTGECADIARRLGEKFINNRAKAQ